MVLSAARIERRIEIRKKSTVSCTLPRDCMLILNAEAISLSLLCIMMILALGVWGHVGCFFVSRLFLCREASFHPSWSCSGFDMHNMRLASAPLLVWVPAAMSNHWSLETLLILFWGKGGSGRVGGLLVCSFSFYRLHTEWMQCLDSRSGLLASNGPCAWSAGCRAHFETTGVWVIYIKNVPNAWSSDCVDGESSWWVVFKKHAEC